MNIAIDFDDTITADGKCFVNIIKEFQKAGHTIYIVSSRRNTMDNYRYIEHFLLKHLSENDSISEVGILLCYDEPKQMFVRRNKIDISIWIDNDPNSITKGR